MCPLLPRKNKRAKGSESRGGICRQTTTSAPACRAFFFQRGHTRRLRRRGGRSSRGRSSRSSRSRSSRGRSRSRSRSRVQRADLGPAAGGVAVLKGGHDARDAVGRRQESGQAVGGPAAALFAAAAHGALAALKAPEEHGEGPPVGDPDHDEDGNEAEAEPGAAQEPYREEPRPAPRRVLVLAQVDQVPARPAREEPGEEEGPRPLPVAEVEEGVVGALRGRPGGRAAPEDVHRPALLLVAAPAALFALFALLAAGPGFELLPLGVFALLLGRAPLVPALGPRPLLLLAPRPHLDRLAHLGKRGTRGDASSQNKSRHVGSG